MVQEIASAIETGKPLYPVLIDGTPMPRRDELPAQIQALPKFNAESISDSRWKADVLRLGKVISLDVPSANEQKLNRIRLAISFALFASLTFAAGIVSRNRFNRYDEFIALWQAGVPFVVIVSGTAVLAAYRHLIDEYSRRHIDAAIATGALGSLLFFVLLLLFDNDKERIVTFFGSISTGALMYSFMTMSGFKSK